MIDEQKFLAAIRSSNAEERFAAWRDAGEAPPSAIPALGQLAGGADPAVAKAAAEALTTMVHAVGKSPGAANRGAVVKGLLTVAEQGPLPARVHALRLLSNIAGEDSVPAIANYLKSPELREEAVFALERIPGSAAAKAIMDAYPSAPADFQPRLLAALGHVRATDAAPLVERALHSGNKEIALAAARAYGRIGAKGWAAYPALDAYTGLQRNDLMDGMLRQADALARQGGPAEAMAIYRTALARPEEHWQCAAIVGLSKIGTTEAAAAIQPKLKSDQRTVRITAQQAWRRMAG